MLILSGAEVIIDGVDAAVRLTQDIAERELVEYGLSIGVMLEWYRPDTIKIRISSEDNLGC